MPDIHSLLRLALIGSLVLWVVTWWHTGPFHVTPYNNYPSALAFTPDGELLVVESGRGITTPIADPDAYSLAVSPDGRSIATGGSGVVRLWDRASGRLLHTLAHAQPGAQVGSLDVPTIDVLAFSPDSQLLATSAGDRRAVRVWQVADGQLRYAIPLAAGSLAFSADGQELVVGADSVHIYRVADGHAIRQIAAEGEVQLSPDGQLLAVRRQNSADGLRLFRYQDGTLLHTFAGAYGYSYVAAFSPDSQYLATVYNSAGSGGLGIRIPPLFTFRVPIAIWHTRDWRPVQTMAGHPGGSGQLAFSLDGRQLASGGSDNTVRQWPVAPHDPQGYALGPLSVLLVLAGGVARWVWQRRQRSGF